MCPCSLDSKEHVLLLLWSFQGARGPVAHEKNRPQVDGLSKLNSVDVEVDVIPGEPECPDGPKAIDGSDAYRSKSSGIP